MPAGFPVKQNYAAGDILTATQMNDLSSTLNYLDPTAKGDLFPASSGTALSRLAVGNNGETLVADSSTSTGLRYQGSMAAGRNFVIGGGFDIWQRGTSFATGSLNYFADRWQSARGGQVAGLTISRQATSDTTNLPFIQYCARVQRDSGNTSTNALLINTAFESVNSIPLVGKAVTFSFYARRGANYSATSNVLSARLQTGTGTDQNNLSAGFTGQTNAIAISATLTTTWQRFESTVTLSSSATQAAVQFEANPTGTAGANDWFEVTGVQVEVGSVATQFSRAGATIQGELSACMRYFQKSYAQGTNPGTVTASNYIMVLQQSAVGYGAYAAAVKLPAVMRTSPTYTVYAPDGTTSALADAAAVTTMAAGSGTVGTNSNDSSLVIRNITTTPAAITPNFGGFSFHYTASAEL